MSNQKNTEPRSLSKILDELIYLKVQSSRILQFLKKNQESLQDIFKHSAYAARLYQLDFILSLSAAEGKEMVLMLFDESSFSRYRFHTKPYLCWQLLRSKSRKATQIAYDLRAFLKKTINESNFSLRHPYASTFGKEAEQFDERLMKACAEDFFAEEISNWNDDTFRRYLDCYDHSLFRERFLQLDVFLKMSDIRKLVFLNHLKKTCHDMTEDLLIQILDSDCCVEIKKLALEANREIEYEFCEDHPFVKYLEYKKFSKLYLKLTLDGVFEWKDLILEELRRNRISLLKDWIKTCPEEFDSSFNISELVIALDEEKKNKRRKAA